MTKNTTKQKIQQVNLRDPPGKVVVTGRELQYHSNSHKTNLNSNIMVTRIKITLHDL